MAVENAAPPVAVPGERVKSQARTRAMPPPVAAAAVLIALIVVGAVFRVLVARQSVFADELSTYWISVPHGLGRVLSLLYSSGRIQHAEITPPLSFLASWVTTRAGTSPVLLRLPALIAGTTTIPLVYLLGLRTVGRRAALLAAALTALSPFMIYYSAEARAYGLMMFLLCGSTLSLLLAVDTGRARFWGLYAVCAAAAFYTHYTCAFVLGVQFLWLLWAHPAERRRGLIATAAAAALVIPWIPGLVADLQSPTVKILSALSAFTPNAVRIDIQHWALGYPYTTAGGLGALPGVPALVLVGVAAILAFGGVLISARRTGGWSELLRRVAPSVGTDPRSRRVLLVALLMLATPVGEILASAIGNHIIGVRDLAASWPFLALTAAAVVAAAGPVVGAVAAGLAVIAFALAASKMLETRFARPDYQGAAGYVSAHARAGDAVIDGTGGISPGPLTGFDVAFHHRLPVFRALAPAERDHPFTVFDPFVPIQNAMAQALAAAHGDRVFIISAKLTSAPDHLAPPRLPGGYVRVAEKTYGGIEQTVVSVYERPPGSQP